MGWYAVNVGVSQYPDGFGACQGPVLCLLLRSGHVSDGVVLGWGSGAGWFKEKGTGTRGNVGGDTREGKWWKRGRRQRGRPGRG